MNNYSFVDQSKNNYPNNLRRLKSPPTGLYVKGDLKSDTFERSISIVGSRHVTPYAEKVIGKLIRELAPYNPVIVSGFMYGVDAMSHMYAIQNDLKTVAVMPCGIDIVCPDNQYDLYDTILDAGGLILTEFEAGVLPKVWTFPARNRIVAGISQAVLVIEAGKKSGSLITTRYAKSFGREVLCVPASIFSKNFEGINTAYKEGGRYVTSGQEIAEILGWTNELPKEGFMLEEAQIISYLPDTFDSLLVKSNYDVPKLRSVLLDLEFSGKIYQDHGEFNVSKC